VNQQMNMPPSYRVTRLWAGRPKNWGFDSRQCEEILLFTPSRPTDPGAHPASSAIDIGVISPGIEQLGPEPDHSLSPTADVKNAQSYTSLPHTSSWRGVKSSTETT
jgi:hypothetical protein